MKGFRLTLAGMMGVIVLAALGMVALKQANLYWASGLFSLDLVLVFAMVSVAILRTGRARAFAVGAAVFGGGYLAVWSHEGYGRLIGAPIPPVLTIPLIEVGRPAFEADRLVVDSVAGDEVFRDTGISFQSGPTTIISAPSGHQVFPIARPRKGRGDGRVYDVMNFRRVGHALTALMMGLGGGVFGLLIRPRNPSS